MKPFAAAKNFLLDILFPVFCARCGSEGDYLCQACRLTLPMIAPSCFVCKKLVPGRGAVPAGRTCRPCRQKSRVYAFFSPYSYGDPTVRALIHRLKYGRMRGIAPELADLIAASLAFYRTALPEDALLIPIPLHKRREAERGFNQAWLLAHSLGDRIGRPAQRHILVKIKKTPSQMALSAEERMKNLTDVFVVSDTTQVSNKTCVLVDDVKTTGATIEQAAVALRRAGARRVWAMTVAH